MGSFLGFLFYGYDATGTPISLERFQLTGGGVEK